MILNSGALVAHNCKTFDFAHISGNATLGSGAEVGDGVLIEMNAVVMPDL